MLTINEMVERAKTAKEDGAKARVFDWNKAAEIIRDRKVKNASAGLREDFGATSGCIYKDGKIVRNPGTYLASLWATPVLLIDDEEIECWAYMEDTHWDAHTVWPSSAVRVLKEVVA